MKHQQTLWPPPLTAQQAKTTLEKKSLKKKKVASRKHQIHPNPSTLQCNKSRLFQRVQEGRDQVTSETCGYATGCPVLVQRTRLAQVGSVDWMLLYLVSLTNS